MKVKIVIYLTIKNSKIINDNTYNFYIHRYAILFYFIYFAFQIISQINISF